MKRNCLAGILSCFLLSPVYAILPTTIIPVTAIQASETKLNLNNADAQALSKSIKGIGLRRAEAIIKYREAHGSFKSVTELSEVPGIGKNFVGKHLVEIEKKFSVK